MAPSGGSARSQFSAARRRWPLTAHGALGVFGSLCFRLALLPFGDAPAALARSIHTARSRHNSSRSFVLAPGTHQDHGSLTMLGTLATRGSLYPLDALDPPGSTLATLFDRGALRPG